MKFLRSLINWYHQHASSMEMFIQRFCLCHCIEITISIFINKYNVELCRESAWRLQRCKILLNRSLPWQENCCALQKRNEFHKPYHTPFCFQMILPDSPFLCIVLYVYFHVLYSSEKWVYLTENILLFFLILFIQVINSLQQECFSTLFP